MKEFQLQRGLTHHVGNLDLVKEYLGPRRERWSPVKVSDLPWDKHCEQRG